MFFRRRSSLLRCFGSSIAGAAATTTTTPSRAMTTTTTASGLPFLNTTTVVTGGSRGIGESIARTFRQLGSKVVIVGRDHNRLSSARARMLLPATGNPGPSWVRISGDDDDNDDELDGVALLPGDISSVGEVERVVRLIAQRHGPVDHLINAAGIAGSGLLVTMTPAEVDEIIATNLFGTIHMSRGIARGMIKRGKGGCIINVSSVLGIKGLEGQSVYSASKAGIIGFTRSLARELGPKGIRVCAIAPGFIDTDMTAAIPEARKESYRAATPLGRFGKPEEVAQAAVFLAQSTFVTGQTLVIDGGLTA